MPVELKQIIIKDSDYENPIEYDNIAAIVYSDSDEINIEKAYIDFNRLEIHLGDKGYKSKSYPSPKDEGTIKNFMNFQILSETIKITTKDKKQQFDFRLNNTTYHGYIRDFAKA